MEMLFVWICELGGILKRKRKYRGRCVNIGILWADFFALDSTKGKLGGFCRTEWAKLDCSFLLVRSKKTYVAAEIIVAQLYLTFQLGCNVKYIKFVGISTRFMLLFTVSIIVVIFSFLLSVNSN